MNLIHFSKIEIPTNPYFYENKTPRDSPEMEFFKPSGLWVSDEAAEDSWSWWCKNENFVSSWYRYVYRITLLPGHNILHLDHLGDFTHCYPLPSDHPMAKIGLSDYSTSMYIDWPRIKEHYEGLLITPYQWHQRMQVMWYYSWDCASGCIWDISNIRISLLYESENFNTEMIENAVEERKERDLFREKMRDGSLLRELKLSGVKK